MSAVPVCQWSAWTGIVVSLTSQNQRTFAYDVLLIPASAAFPWPQPQKKSFTPVALRVRLS